MTFSDTSRILVSKCDGEQGRWQGCQQKLFFNTMSLYWIPLIPYILRPSLALWKSVILMLRAPSETENLTFWLGSAFRCYSGQRYFPVKKSPKKVSPPISAIAANPPDGPRFLHFQRRSPEVQIEANLHRHAHISRLGPISVQQWNSTRSQEAKRVGDYLRKSEPKKSFAERSRSFCLRMLNFLIETALFFFIRMACPRYNVYRHTLLELPQHLIHLEWEDAVITSIETQPLRVSMPAYHNIYHVSWYSPLCFDGNPSPYVRLNLGRYVSRVS